MLTNKKIKFLLIGAFIIFFLLILSITSNAASASISCDSSATVGETITINVTGTGVQWNLDLIANGNVIASSNELDNYEGNKTISFSGTYTPTATGTINVRLEGSVTEASDGTVIRSFGSKTITVTEPTPDPEPTPAPEPTPEPEPEQPSEEKPKFTLEAITIDETRYENGAILTVDNDKDSISVKAVDSSNYATTVNGNSISGFSVKLNEGTNTIVVTDLNGGGSVKVTVRRLAKEGETPPNVMENTEASENTIDEGTAEEDGLKLNTLKIDGLELSPKFDPNVFSYTVNINMDKKDYSSLDIEAVANDDKATVSIDGNQNLQEGENIINIILTSEDGKEIVTYQLVVNKITSASEVVGATTSTTDIDNQNKIILIAAGAIVLVIIIVVIILLVRRHKMMNSDYDEYDGYGLYNYDLYNNQDDNNELKDNEEDDVYKLDTPEEDNNYDNYNDYSDNSYEGKKKKRRGKGKHA